jgi:enoyl-CoA hydratase/carnithine racemase
VGSAAGDPDGEAGESTGSVLVDRPREGVVRLRLNRPARRNAINAAVLAGLRGAFEEPGVRALVLSSATPGMFCAGADLSLTPAARAEVSDGLYALYRQMIESDAPIIAALGGPAVGGGAQLAIASDLRVVEPGAWIRFVGPGHGLAVGAWGLPSLIGRGRATDLCLTGRRVEAEEALAMGLVDRIAPDAGEAALELAGVLAALDPGAVARAKAVIGRSSARGEALALEADGNRSWSGAAPRPGGPDAPA